MSEALSRIFALQQRELNEKERHRQREIAKQQRIIAAFQASGLLDIFDEFRNVPLRPDVRARIYKSNIGELCWQNGIERTRQHDLSFMALHGTSSGPRWWCEESRDTGRIRYGYRSGRSGVNDEFFDTPDGLWTDQLIEYMAAAADTDTIAQKIQSMERTERNTAAPVGRRQMQPV